MSNWETCRKEAPAETPAAGQGERPCRPPNVVLVMTDDQGYGDLGCTGNPRVHTPHLDRFARECTRCVDFHVSPLCTPTRGALMTGRNPLRNGAWATTWGRSLLRADEVTLAQAFAAGGYRTGMFGKWHLGDNYPYRPQDRGFQTVVAHRGGGVGQTPDFWGNSYFNDTYWHNGTPVSHTGYCTDIWFEEALKFIESNRNHPFFCYLATNAPHGPYRVAEQYQAPYRDDPRVPQAAFYGMITNIDENFGRLVAQLDAWGLRENTILIFMTDNGTAAGYSRGRGYNAGMRGTKGSYYDGGHRVPFFIRWPGGGLRADTEVHELVTHLDLFPTFLEFCGLETPPQARFDGLSVAPLLRGQPQELPDRLVFLQYRQHTRPPEPWDCGVMTRRWRLIGGRELYEIRTDPGQERDRAAEHPEVVARLRAAYEAWWAEVAPGLEAYCPITIGSDHENPSRLDAFDLMGDVAWNQTQVREALQCQGAWAVELARDGDYEFAVRRWPEETGAALTAGLAEGPSVAIAARAVRLRVAGFDETREVSEGAGAVTFRARLQAGRASLEARFLDAQGESQGAYYVYVRRLP